MSRANVDLVLRGYRAFVAGDLLALAELLDPEIEWRGVDGESSSRERDEVLRILAERSAAGFRIQLERCVAKDDEVAVAFRASRADRDPFDERPLQTRRRYTIGRYHGIVTFADGRIVRVQDYPHLAAALDALGLDEAHI